MTKIISHEVNILIKTLEKITGIILINQKILINQIILKPYIQSAQSEQTGKTRQFILKGKFRHHLIIIYNHNTLQIPNHITCKKHEITKPQFTNFSQIPIATESLQMMMNPYLMGESPISSLKPLMVITGTDTEYSVEE